VFIKYYYEKFYENKEIATRKVSDIQFYLGMLLTEYTQSIDPPSPIVPSTPSSNTDGPGSRVEHCKRKFA